MNTWEQIDALKAKFEAEMKEAKATVADRLSKRAATTLRTEDVWWVCTHERRTYKARTAAELLAALPLKPKAKTVLG